MSRDSELTTQPRVLIVEDEAVVAMDLDRSLVQLGYEVVGTADNADEALGLAEQFCPDLVLMDIQLRGSIDGIAAAQEIRNRWQIPVVYLTANANEETLARARTTGAYGYLIKPFRTKDLNATLLLALSQHRSARELFSDRTWLRTLLDSVSDGVIATDAEGQVRYLNPAAMQITGWSSPDAIGKPIEHVYDLLNMRGEPVHPCQLRKALASASPVSKERFILRSRTGKTLPIEDAAAPILAGERPVGAVSIFVDISERVRQERLQEEARDRLEEEVHRTTEALGQTRAELRALSGHLMTAQEDERRRLARELHDDFGQRTAILDMQIASALEQLDKGPSEREQLLLRIREQIAQLGSELRKVSHRLHPSVIEDLGLVAALRSLAESFRDGGGEIIMRLPARHSAVTLDTATALYRIAQEALRNAARHAQGAAVRLMLSSTDHALQLTIQDAGPGFDIFQARSHGGLGLLGMQERARLAGGTLLVKTKSGEGTVITVRVPAEFKTSTD